MEELDEDIRIMKEKLPFSEERINRIEENLKKSLIQRFEITYDCLWKILARYMKEELGRPDIPNSPKPIFRLAGENNLLSSGVESWLEYVDLRIDTTHDYDEKKAQSCLDKIGAFLQGSILLYEQMSNTKWS